MLMVAGTLAITIKTSNIISEPFILPVSDILAFLGTEALTAVNPAARHFTTMGKGLLFSPRPQLSTRPLSLSPEGES